MNAQPTIYSNENCDTSQALLRACLALQVPYRPPHWAKNTHAQTVLFLLKELGSPPISWDKTEVLIMEDGGTLSLQWAGLLERRDPRTPVLVMLPTIAGNGDDHRGFVQTMQRGLGWTVVVCNRRGHIGLPMSTPQFNTMGNTRDLRRQLEVIAAECPDAPVYGVGLSAGSGLLVRYLGESGAQSVMRAAVAFCPGYDVPQVFHHTNPFYSRLMARKLVRYFLRRNASVLRRVKGYGALAASQNLVEFHDRCFPFTGYDTRDAYYKASNPMVVADGMRVPLLVINASDDPVTPISMVHEYGLPLLGQVPGLLMVVTARGGHCSHYEAPWGSTSWSDRVIIDYLKSVHATLNGS